MHEHFAFGDRDAAEQHAITTRAEPQVVADVNRGNDDAELAGELFAQRCDALQQLATARRVDHVQEVETDLEAEQLDRQGGFDLAALRFLVGTSPSGLGGVGERARGVSGIRVGHRIFSTRRRPSGNTAEP